MYDVIGRKGKRGRERGEALEPSSAKNQKSSVAFNNYLRSLEAAGPEAGPAASLQVLDAVNAVIGIELQDEGELTLSRHFSGGGFGGGGGGGLNEPVYDGPTGEAVVDGKSVMGDAAVGSIVGGKEGAANAAAKSAAKDVVVGVAVEVLEHYGYEDEAAALDGVTTLSNPFASIEEIDGATAAASAYSGKIHDVIVADIQSEDSTFWKVVDLGGIVATPFDAATEALDSLTTEEAREAGKVANDGR